MTGAACKLEVKDVHRRYHLAGHELHVLRGVSLQVHEGERVFLCGPSGSGKTTLLYILGGLEKPTEGDVFVSGNALYGSAGSKLTPMMACGVMLSIFFPILIGTFGYMILKERSLVLAVLVLVGLPMLSGVLLRLLKKRLGELPPHRNMASQRARVRNKELGFVFQNYHLLPELTALENVALPALIDGRPSQERAKQLLERVGLGERLHHLPTELSGGEQQRVALARALVNDPAIILADEPTGNLDAATGKQIMDLLFDIVAESRKTLLVVTHDANLAERGDRKLMIHQGQLQ
jgi:predicted ABC-type transport system involved in lysophospholipase L1 biosynthesis ATPase subunit